MADNNDGGCAEKMCSYIKTKKGFILTAETILNFTLAMFYTSIYVFGFGFYLTFPIFELIYSILYFLFFSMEWDNMGRRIAWVWSDLFRAATAAIIYIVISIIFLKTLYWYTLHILTGVLCLLAGLLYGYDTYTIVQQIQSST